MVWIDLKALPDNSTSWKDIEEVMKQVNSLSLTFSAEKEIKPIEAVKISISKETKYFLERHCNIERNVVGEDIYVLNNLRFKIIEEW
jgi:ethanolamine utilization cobalamin adenosyltransferase